MRVGIELMQQESEDNRHHDRVECDLRQLALVDRIIGLEAQLAYLKSAQAKSGLGNTDMMTSSMTWRAGRLVMAPLRLGKKVMRRAKIW